MGGGQGKVIQYLGWFTSLVLRTKTWLGGIAKVDEVEVILGFRFPSLSYYVDPQWC